MYPIPIKLHFLFLQVFEFSLTVVQFVMPPHKCGTAVIFSYRACWNNRMSGETKHTSVQTASYKYEGGSEGKLTVPLNQRQNPNIGNCQYPMTVSLVRYIQHSPLEV
jgi:hypothetical protein